MFRRKKFVCNAEVAIERKVCLETDLQVREEGRLRTYQRK
jgi:hypothetical protein